MSRLYGGVHDVMVYMKTREVGAGSMVLRAECLRAEHYLPFVTALDFSNFTLLIHF